MPEPTTPEQTIQVERIAEAFHVEYEAFAWKHGWVTQAGSRVAFDDLPSENRAAMLDTVAALLDRGLIRAALSNPQEPGGGEQIDVGALSQSAGALLGAAQALKLLGAKANLDAVAALLHEEGTKLGSLAASLLPDPTEEASK